MNTIKVHTHTKGLKFKELGEGAKLDIITSKEQKFTHKQKDTTNGSKRVRIEAYKDMAFNSVIRVMQKSERASKQRDERRAKRAR
jgi:hypothetical protein